MIDKASAFQKEISKKLNIKIAPTSYHLSAAILSDFLSDALDLLPPDEATYNQIEYGKKLGLNLSEDTIRTAKAKIRDELYKRNQMAIKKYEIKEGSIIQFIDSKNVTERVISTLKDNGRIYFKGKNMTSFYASKIDGIKIKVKNL